MRSTKNPHQNVVSYALEVFAKMGGARGVGARKRFQDAVAGFPAYWIAQAEQARGADPFVNQWGTGMSEFRGRWKGLFAPVNPDREFAVARFDGAAVVTPAGRNYTASLSGFTAYRQIPSVPDVGTVHGLNLVKNGGFQSGADFWTLHANASVVPDSTSVTGYAVRLVATAATQVSYQDITIEPGKAYSLAAQLHSDGAATAYITVQAIAIGTTPSATSPVADTIIGSTSGAAWVEVSLANYVAPGNANRLRFWFYTYPTAGTAYLTGLRVKQQSTAPLAWTAADQQVLGNQGLAIYEAGQNLLTNGDIESALSSTVNGFLDPFADLNAYVFDNGTPTVATNLVSCGAAPTNLRGGHTEWWDMAAGSQLRFKFVTATQPFLELHNSQAGGESYVLFLADGTNFSIAKQVTGTFTNNLNAATPAALTNGTFYWFSWTVTGTSFSCSILNDAAGAPGTVVATQTATITDTVLQSGQIKFGNWAGAGTCQFGGAFPAVCRVVIAAPPGWTTTFVAGVSAFAVSKTNKFSGIQSLSIYNNHNAANGYWQQGPFTLTNTLPYTMSGRMKTSNVVTASATGARVTFATIAGSPYITGTADWQTRTVTGTGAGAADYSRGQLNAASGTAWFDLLWLAQQAYDTGNADPTGLAYTTGTRPASSDTQTLPTGFDWTQGFGIVGTYRPDVSPSARQGMIVCLYLDGSNYISFDYFGGALRLFKVRLGNAIGAQDGSATSLAVGDTLAYGFLFIPGTGLYLVISKNGGAQATYSNTSAEAQLATFAGGTPTLYVGRHGSAGIEADGTVGIDRIEKPTSLAYIQAVVGMVS